MPTQRNKTNRKGPVLPDGTALWDLIDFDRREIAMRVMVDPDLHQIEQRKVFAKSWVGVGHVSDVPNAGDFVLRYIGEDRVIVTRDREGGVNVLLNACAHRGMEVCWAEQGNQANFKCPYHGWVFDPSGDLLGVPFEKEMYGDWNKAEYGLTKAKVEIRHGFIFANLDDKAISLDEWMGDFGWYLDHIYKGCDDYEPIAPPTRFTINSNWKAIGDQNAGDLYHLAGAHAAIMELGFMPNIMAQIDVVKVGFPGGGHNIFGLNPMSRQMSGELVTEDPEKAYSFDDRSFIHMLFPITTGGTNRSFRADDGTVIGTASLNTYMPRGVGSFEVWQESYCDKRVPQAARDMMVTQGALTVSLLQDDSDAVQSMQTAARGGKGQQHMMKYNSVLGENKPKGWPGPGVVHAGFAKDDTNWWFWNKWFDMMAAEEA